MTRQGEREEGRKTGVPDTGLTTALSIATTALLGMARHWVRRYQVSRHSTGVPKRRGCSQSKQKPTGSPPLHLMTSRGRSWRHNTLMH